MLCPYVNQYPAGEGLLQAYLRESVARDLSWDCLILGAIGVLMYALLTRAGLWLEGGLCLGLGLLCATLALMFWPTLSVLQLDSGEAIVVANSGFTRGEPEHFWPFLERMMTRHGAGLDQKTPKCGGREQI